MNDDLQLVQRSDDDDDDPFASEWFTTFALQTFETTYRVSDSEQALRICIEILYAGTSPTMHDLIRRLPAPRVIGSVQ